MHNVNNFKYLNFIFLINILYVEKSKNLNDNLINHNSLNFHNLFYIHLSLYTDT